MPQSIQVDAFHLFSIGEGVAYGSSVMNYAVSGAPVAAFKVELSDEYFNVEFTGKDIRNWQKAEGGYVVQLHTPVSGAYTLLATYERPFKAQGDTLSFTGAKPADAQSEQGHTLIISAYQFQVKAVDGIRGIAEAGDGRSAAGVPSLFRRAGARRVSLRRAAIRSETRAESARAGRFAEPGGGSRVARHAHLEGRPGAHRRALLCEKSRQREFPAHARGRHAALVRDGEWRIGRAGEGRQRESHPAAAAGGSERSARRSI